MFLGLTDMKNVDIIFFIVCASVIALGVLIYFLYPLIFSAKFKQQREDLRKREEAFKSNQLKASDETEEVSE